MAMNGSGRRFQIPLFFFLTYLIAWAVSAPTVLKAHGLINWEIPGAGTWGLVRMGWVWLLVAIVGPVALSLIALIAATAATVLMSWVQNKAGSSLPAVLFHAAMNTGFAAFGTLTSGPRLFWICTGTWVVAASAICLATGLSRTIQRAPGAADTGP
jgi:hypothetical protein